MARPIPRQRLVPKRKTTAGNSRLLVIVLVVLAIWALGAVWNQLWVAILGSAFAFLIWMSLSQRWVSKPLLEGSTTIDGNTDPNVMCVVGAHRLVELESPHVRCPSCKRHYHSVCLENYLNANQDSSCWGCGRVMFSRIAKLNPEPIVRVNTDSGSRLISSSRRSDKEKASTTRHPDSLRKLLANETIMASLVGGCPNCGAEVFKQNMSCWNCKELLPLARPLLTKPRTIPQNVGRISWVSVDSISRIENGTKTVLRIDYSNGQTTRHEISLTLTWKPKKIFGRVVTGGLHEVQIGMPATQVLLARIEPPNHDLRLLTYERFKLHLLNEGLLFLGPPRLGKTHCTLEIVVDATVRSGLDWYADFTKRLLIVLGGDAVTPNFKDTLERLCPAGTRASLAFQNYLSGADFISATTGDELSNRKKEPISSLSPERIHEILKNFSALFSREDIADQLTLDFLPLIDARSVGGGVQAVAESTLAHVLDTLDLGLAIHVRSKSELQGESPRIVLCVECKIGWLGHSFLCPKCKKLQRVSFSPSVAKLATSTAEAISTGWVCNRCGTLAHSADSPCLTCGNPDHRYVEF